MQNLLNQLIHFENREGGRELLLSLELFLYQFSAGHQDVSRAAAASGSGYSVPLLKQPLCCGGGGQCCMPPSEPLPNRKPHGGAGEGGGAGHDGYLLSWGLPVFSILVLSPRSDTVGRDLRSVCKEF